MQKFLINQEHEIRKYYESNGYVILESLLPKSVIDAFLKNYEIIKKNKLFVYYSQSIHQSIRPSLTSEGFIRESMGNPTRLKFFPNFSSTMQDCLLHNRVSKSLSTLSGSEEHVMWQNMFFDFSTGTIEHQDHWYLDTNPTGHLIAAWYALEDIHPDAGCFFVLPESHKGNVLDKERYPSHEEFRIACIEYIKRSNYKHRSFPLKKGDVLFWHPFTIHGAYSNVNPRYSRKSLTAHFYPVGFERLGCLKQPKVRKTSNPKLFTAYKDLDTIWCFKQYIKYCLSYLVGNTKPRMDMRRKSYKNMAN